MSDYISIQEALEKINDLAREAFRLDDGYGYYFGALHDVADVLRKMPTIDAVPVVRCKDCRWRTDSEYIRWHPCDEVAVNDDWFCADGERKDDDKR